MPSGALRSQASLLREELTAMIPALEIIVARRLGPGDDARDAVQEILARALEAIEANRPIHESLAAFVRGIAVHVIADARMERRRMPIADDDTDLLPASQTEPLQLMIDEQNQRAMELALARLDPEDRELLRRCFIGGEKTADIAKSSGEPASRVRKRKSRALQQLRALLGPRGESGHTLLESQTEKA